MIFFVLLGQSGRTNGSYPVEKKSFFMFQIEKCPLHKHVAGQRLFFGASKVKSCTCGYHKSKVVSFFALISYFLISEIPHDKDLILCHVDFQ